jgi:hypothetical protein
LTGFRIDAARAFAHHRPSMKRLFPPLLLALALLATGCATHLEKKETFLRAAGFRSVNPSTPAQIANVRSLPQGHINRQTRDGKTLYLLADAGRNLLLVGGEEEYERYQEILYAKEVEPGRKADRFTKGLENVWNQGWGSVLGSMIPH